MTKRTLTESINLSEAEFTMTFLFLREIETMLGASTADSQNSDILIFTFTFLVN